MIEVKIMLLVFSLLKKMVEFFAQYYFVLFGGWAFKKISLEVGFLFSILLGGLVVGGKGRAMTCP